MIDTITVAQQAGSDSWQIASVFINGFFLLVYIAIIYVMIKTLIITKKQAEDTAEEYRRKRKLETPEFAISTIGKPGKNYLFKDDRSKEKPLYFLFTIVNKKPVGLVIDKLQVFVTLKDKNITYNNKIELVQGTHLQPTEQLITSQDFYVKRFSSLTILNSIGFNPHEGKLFTCLLMDTEFSDLSEISIKVGSAVFGMKDVPYLIVDGSKQREIKRDFNCIDEEVSSHYNETIELMMKNKVPIREKINFPKEKKMKGEINFDLKK